MKPVDEELYVKALQAHLSIEPVLQRLRADNVTSVTDLADHIYALREVSRVLEDLRRSISGVQSMFEKLLTTVYIAMGPSAPDKIVTDHATFEIVPELGTTVPQPSSPVYEQFLSFLGIPSEVAHHEVVKVHFPGWCSYYTALQARGEDLPEALHSALTTYDMTNVKIRKRKSMKGAHDVFESSDSCNSTEGAT